MLDIIENTDRNKKKIKEINLRKQVGITMIDMIETKHLQKLSHLIKINL